MNCENQHCPSIPSSEEDLITALSRTSIATTPINIIFDDDTNIQPLLESDYDIIEQIELERRSNCNTPTPYSVQFPEEYNYKVSPDVENHVSFIDELHFRMDGILDNDMLTSRTYHQYYIFSIFPSASMAKTIIPREFSLFDRHRYDRLLRNDLDSTKHTTRRYPRDSIPTRESIERERAFENNFYTFPYIHESRMGPHITAATTIANEFDVENHISWRNPMSYFKRIKSFVATPVDTSDTIKHYFATQLRDLRATAKGRYEHQLPSDPFNFGKDTSANDNRGTVIVNIYLHGDEQNFLIQDGALGTKYVTKLSLYHSIIDVCADFFLSPFIIDNSCATNIIDSTTTTDVDLDPYALHHSVLNTIFTNCRPVTDEKLEPISILDKVQFREMVHLPEQLIYQPNSECMCDNEYNSAYTKAISQSPGLFFPSRDSPQISSWLNSQYPTKLDYLIQNYVESNHPIIDRPIPNFVDSMVHLYKDVDSQFTDFLKTAPNSTNLFQHIISKDTQHQLDRLSVTNILDVLAYTPIGTPQNILSYLPQSNDYTTFEDFNSHRLCTENYPIPHSDQASLSFQAVDYLYGQGTSRCFIIAPKANSITKFISMPTTTALSNKHLEVGLIKDKFLLTPSYIAMSTLFEYLRGRDFNHSSCHRCLASIMCRSINDVSQSLNMGSFHIAFSQCFNMNHHSIVNSRIFDPTRTIPSYHTDSISHEVRPVIRAIPYDHVSDFGDFLQRVYYDHAYAAYLRHSIYPYYAFGDNFVTCRLDDLILVTLFSILCGHPDIPHVAIKPQFFPRPTLSTINYHRRLKYILTIDTENHITSFNPSPLSRMANSIRHNLSLLKARDSFEIFPPNSSVYSQVA